MVSQTWRMDHLESVMNLPQVKEGDGAGQFEAGEGDEVEAGEHGEAPLVVADEASEAGLPGEGSFAHPPPGREDEAALGLGEPDHVEADAVGRRVRLGS